MIYSTTTPNENNS